MPLKLAPEKKAVRVEVLPLVDVVFLVLVAFVWLMTRMDVVEALEVEVPTAATGEAADSPLVVSLDRDNRLMLGGMVCSLVEVTARAANQIRETGRPLVIRGDRGADLGVALELMGALRRAGIDRVSFQVQEPGR